MNTPTKKERSIVSTVQNVNESSPLVCDSSVIPGIENARVPMVLHTNISAHKSVMDYICVTRLKSFDESESMKFENHGTV